ncbi:carboxymuconolactone decarboxylase family protein [Archangium violaceum]|uniref:carboxymuconolactone decarboxylase family protein n=1 Tax=Archangium violaceum TaxID=83451 RepID=UPI002B28B358|nr:carboxymuconolactone decarboxylase family protein [Archangium violaceum]
MSRLTPGPHGHTPFEQLLGHNALILERWSALEEAFSTAPGLPPRLREELRRTLAFINGCAYCMAKGAPATEHPDPREAAAVDFTRQAAKDPRAVPDEAFNRLREHFTEAQVSELCAYISFISAAQRLGALLQLEPVCELPVHGA